jgi:ornithine cyclodeaminase/alanine dehydrogenase
MTAREAVSEADIVVTSVTFTPDVVPFLDARWLKPGVFAAITDHAAPWVAESLTAFDRIVVDDVEQERRMPTPLVDPALVAGDLTGLVGGATAGRDHPDERTAFIFRGLALGDLALSALAYQRAVAVGAGIEMER